MTEKTTMQIRMPEDMKKSYLEACKQNDRNGSQLIRDFIREYLKENEQGKLKL